MQLAQAVAAIMISDFVRKFCAEIGDADLVIWTGDPFEPLSQPKAVFIAGKAQPMTSRQIELRDRYKDLSGPYPVAYPK